jgi:glycosyltransferase involved in cell wall biosynthesis
MVRRKRVWRAGLVAVVTDSAERLEPAGQLRFDRIAITCVFGDPRDSRSWSGAPNNLATALEGLGVKVEGIHPRLTRAAKFEIALQDLLTGHGVATSGIDVLRSGRARQRLAAAVDDAARRLGVGHVLHTGALDLPVHDRRNGIRHYLYCDHTWDLFRRHAVDRAAPSAKAGDAYERTEREALASVDHIFTFGAYVRDNLVEHYGIDPGRVTAVGSGMGQIEPYEGPKDYARPRLLFVAKHYFREKGGRLVIDAFIEAHRRRPDLTLTIVGDERSRRFVPRHQAIHFHAHLPWRELQRLYHEATLLTQPMLNDPWGQVFLEALVSRTPVVGLGRNGLPEILVNGRHGFLVHEARAQSLADTIIDAVGDPSRLAQMGRAGQAHVLARYSWPRVARAIALS